MKAKGGEKHDTEDRKHLDVSAGNGMWLSAGKHRKLWYC
jgi:hypothetical protein